MGRKFQYITLDRVISKLYRDLGLDEISEVDIIEWSGEALEAIGAIGLYEEAVAFTEVKNHHADLPNGLHSIIQIARDHEWSKQESTKNICPASIVVDDELEDICQTGDCSWAPDELKDYPVPLDCNGTPLTDYDLAYYRPYFDLQYEYYGWNSSNIYHRRYKPVRLANHSFFNSLVCPEDTDDELYHSCDDEYTIVEDKLRFSFKDGYVAIAYHRQKVDQETGYPLIPDDVSVITAITYYITWKYMARMWYMGREGYADKMQEAKQEWHWYCKQAGNAIFKPYGEDEYQNILEEKNQLIPRIHRYYGFFGKLGRAEYRGWTDPNRRNFRLRGI